MPPGESAGQQVTLPRHRANDLDSEATESIPEAGAASPREQAVGPALERLRAHGWDVLHDVHWPGRRRANIDHVAVGPAGVLVVAAQNWSGVVSAHHGRLRQNGQRRDKELDGVRRAGADVAALMAAPWAEHVMPVLCVAGDHHVAPTQCAAVTAVDVSRLNAWISGLPPALTPAEVLELASDLRIKLPPASNPIPRPSAVRRASRRSERTAAAVFRSQDEKRIRSARRAVVPRQALLILITLLVLALALPTLMHWWSVTGSDVMRSMFSAPAATSAAPALAPPPTPIYGSCRKLWATHPGGVANLGARNTGRKLRRSVVVERSQLLYVANSRLDKDDDGIACEVVRKRASKR
jgi:hypothetical protein